jgi:enamine deaminase RidA (YjgF/YER057c/UK114 family)
MNRSDRASGRDRQTIVPAGWEDTVSELHLSPALKVGDTIYVSGCLGWSPELGGFPDDPEAEIRQAFENVSTVLRESGASWADVVELTTLVVGLNDLSAPLVKVHHEFVSEPYPAWTGFGVTQLYAPGAIVEVAVNAIV